jgi:DNA repair protein RadA/Sms
MSKTLYVCQNCAGTFPKWQGQCSNCGEWNTLVEELQVATPKKGSKSGEPVSASQLQSYVVPLRSVNTSEINRRRISTGIGEFDRVLGGDSSSVGMVPGAVMLMGGEPGIGKSTLLTQLVLQLLSRAKDDDSHPPIVYVSGEESPSQILLRMNRLLETDYKNYSLKKTELAQLMDTDHLQFVTSTDVDEVAALVADLTPSVVIVDSIQTLTTGELSGAPGSVGQVRESADRMTTIAKKLHVPMFLVGHVTKEGAIAGPKVLEHIVDAVLELSGERTGQLRILRAIKNRFGATDEVGVFRVDEVGLAEVSNPSEFFLEHADVAVPGSATTCVMEGTRPLLMEVQALVVSSQLAMPRRVGRGIDVSRIQVLAAVLQKHCRLPLGTHDIFLSAAGGYKVQETGMDLGLVAALASSLKDKPMPKKSVFIGEVGLLGEIRKVAYLERRVKEAQRLGFTKVYSKLTHSHVYDMLKELGVA